MQEICQFDRFSLEINFKRARSCNYDWVQVKTNTGCPKKFARIRGTVHCCFVVKFCFSRVSDKTGNKWSKDTFIQIYN